MFDSTLTIKGAGDLFEAISPEQDDLKSKRANVSFELVGGDIKFHIKANDFSAYRAMQSAVMRLLVTFYKIETLEE